MGAHRRGRERGGDGERGVRLGARGAMGAVGGGSTLSAPSGCLAAWLLREVEENT
jgi:hypothetical protein